MSVDEQNLWPSPRGPVPIGSSGKARSIRVVLLEHDASYRETLIEKLSEGGFVVQGFADHASLLGALDVVGAADVIVLDGVGLKIDGIGLLAALRREGLTQPVVFLANEAQLADECAALDHGATDFICKSRGLEVLTRRIRRVVEVAGGGPVAEEAMICGRLRLSPKISRAYWNDVDVELTLGEYNIVQLLASRIGHYVTYRAIYDCLHYEGFIAGSGSEGYRANVRSAIKRIRNKFRTVAPHFDRIENYTGFGYRWRPTE
jgi:two-component system, OmpR family, response regulator ChvI